MKLAGKTTAELVAIRKAIEDDPTNRIVGGFYLFTAKARKKFDDIDRAIANNIRTERLARGEFVNDAGYSGRQTNRR